MGRKEWTSLPNLLIFLIIMGGCLDDCVEVGCGEFAKKLKHLYYCIVLKKINALQIEWCCIEDVIGARADDNVDHV